MDPQAIERAANSNISFGLAVISILFFLFGIVVGEHLAEELGRRCDGRRQYYLANVAWLMGGVVLSTLVFATGWVAFAAVTIGGSVMGIVGMILFVPMTSAIYQLLRQYVHNGEQSPKRT